MYFTDLVHSVLEGMNEILERLRTDYVDVIFAHRPDPTVPMEEIVRAFNYLINTGKAFYWGTIISLLDLDPFE